MFTEVSGVEFSCTTCLGVHQLPDQADRANVSAVVKDNLEVFTALREALPDRCPHCRAAVSTLVARAEVDCTACKHVMCACCFGYSAPADACIRAHVVSCTHNPARVGNNALRRAFVSDRELEALQRQRRAARVAAVVARYGAGAMTQVWEFVHENAVKNPSALTQYLDSVEFANTCRIAPTNNAKHFN